MLTGQGGAINEQLELSGAIREAAVSAATEVVER